MSPNGSCSTKRILYEAMRPGIDGLVSSDQVYHFFRINLPIDRRDLASLPPRPGHEAIRPHKHGHVINTRNRLVHQVEVQLSEADRVNSGFRYYKPVYDSKAWRLVKCLIDFGQGGGHTLLSELYL